MASERSDYFFSLESEAKSRYLAKTSMIDGLDPYALKTTDFTQDIAHLPLLRSVPLMTLPVHSGHAVMHSLNRTGFTDCMSSQVAIQTSLCIYYTQQVSLHWTKFETIRVFRVTGISRLDGL